MNPKPVALIDLDHCLLNTEVIKSEFSSIKEAMERFAGFRDQEADRYLYEDATRFINYTCQYFTPAIFTEGPIEFQKAKIQHSALGQLIDKSHQFVYGPLTKADNLEKLVKLHQPKLLIDDQPAQLEAAHHLGVATVRVRRGPHATIAAMIPPTLTVTSLEEIIEKDLFANMAVL